MLYDCHHYHHTKIIPILGWKYIGNSVMYSEWLPLTYYHYRFESRSGILLNLFRLNSAPQMVAPSLWRRWEGAAIWDWSLGYTHHHFSPVGSRSSRSKSCLTAPKHLCSPYTPSWWGEVAGITGEWDPPDNECEVSGDERPNPTPLG